MMQKITNWFEEHEIIGAVTASAGTVVLFYACLTPFMILWKKLGLYNK